MNWNMYAVYNNKTKTGEFYINHWKLTHNYAYFWVTVYFSSCIQHVLIKSGWVKLYFFIISLCLEHARPSPLTIQKMCNRVLWTVVSPVCSYNSRTCYYICALVMAIQNHCIIPPLQTFHTLIILILRLEQPLVTFMYGREHMCCYTHNRHMCTTLRLP